MYIEPIQPLLPSRNYRIWIHGEDLAGNGIRGEINDFNTIDEPGSREGRLWLMVIDVNGDPVEDALIFINNNSEGHTESDGIFDLNLRTGTYDLRIEKNGYSTYHGRITIEYDPATEPEPIILEPDEGSGKNFNILPILEMITILSFILLIIVSIGIYVFMERRSIPRIDPYLSNEE
jgi:hypothetical protein